MQWGMEIRLAFPTLHRSFVCPLPGHPPQGGNIVPLITQHVQTTRVNCTSLSFLT